MKRLAMLTALTAFALAMGTGAALADGCGGSNCATDEPIVTTPPQDCGGSGCAVSEPALFQMAEPDGNGGGGRVIPEPAPFQTV